LFICLFVCCIVKKKIVRSDLPQIVVIGNTSSGKSSALSMVSGIRLPSASKLTTCCPIEINLSHDEKISFQGKVFIRKDPSTLSFENNDDDNNEKNTGEEKENDQNYLNTFEQVENEIEVKRKVRSFVSLILVYSIISNRKSKKHWIKQSKKLLLIELLLISKVKRGGF
jgi:energy-coupling factor transporter ATP-binding protein EcfA2